MTELLLGDFVFIVGLQKSQWQNHTIRTGTKCTAKWKLTHMFLKNKCWTFRSTLQ